MNPMATEAMVTGISEAELIKNEPGSNTAGWPVLKKVVAGPGDTDITVDEERKAHTPHEALYLASLDPITRKELELSSGYITKDSGKRQEFRTGAVRDIQDDKPRFDLVPPDALKRVADLYARGAKKYGEWNWQKGIEMSRCYASMYRHMMQFAMGEEDEDHLAAVVFNAFCIMHYQNAGRTDLDDMGKVRGNSEN